MTELLTLAVIALGICVVFLLLALRTVIRSHDADLRAAAIAMVKAGEIVTICEQYRQRDRRHTVLIEVLLGSFPPGHKLLVTAEQWERLKEVGYVPKDAPLPASDEDEGVDSADTSGYEGWLKPPPWREGQNDE